MCCFLNSGKMERETGIETADIQLGKLEGLDDRCRLLSSGPRFRAALASCKLEYSVDVFRVLQTLGEP